MNKLEHVFVTIIASTPEKVWQALTNAEFTRQYWHSTAVQSEFTVGAPIEFLHDDGSVGCEGKILRADYPSELSYTWHFPKMPEGKDEAHSRVTFRLEPIAAGTRLTVTHDRFPDASKVAELVGEGWPFVLGGLKTLLETGKGVDFTAQAN